MNRISAILLLFSLALPLAAEKKWVDKSVLQSIFSIAKKSSIKYEFKPVTVLPFREKDDAAVPGEGRRTRAIAALIRRGKLALRKQDRAGAEEAFRRAFFLDRSLGKDAAFLRASGWEKGFFPDAAAVPVLLRRTPSGSVGIYYIKNIRGLKTHFSWITYALSRAFWRFEGAWRRRFPDARWYRPSFEEDVFCYKILVYTWQETKKREDGLTNSDLDHLLALDRDGLLEGYVFCQVYSAPIGKDNAYILTQYGKSIRSYMDRLSRRK